MSNYRPDDKFDATGIFQVARAHRHKFLPGFEQWLVDNWHVWARFHEEANRIWARGRNHYSARTIIEYIRHETMIAEKGGLFKINDHNTPDLARLYLIVYPERSGFFSLRDTPR